MYRFAAVCSLVGASWLGYDAANSEEGAESPVEQTASETQTLVRAEATPGVGKPADAAPDEIKQLVSGLRSAREFLHETKDYSATFTQQVRKGEYLLDPETIQLKVQHEPFGVFLHWEQDGQQALYVEGANDGKLLVHPTRGFGRLRNVWEVPPDSRLAMRKARRPVTELGILNLVDLLLGFHYEHILASNCTMEKTQEAGKSCTKYVMTFTHPDQNPFYWKTNLWLCSETDMPLRIENYEWTEDGEQGPLIEIYAYTDICLEECVTPEDFDRKNKAYSF